VKSFFRYIHQWFCNHDVVFVSSQAHYKQNEFNKMKIICSICGKKFYKYGHEIAKSECLCKGKIKNG